MNGFLSYSHDDHDLFEAFQPHLAALKRAYGLTIWTDHRIHTGSAWEQKIADAIAAADIFVLLVSHNFIASDYVWNAELPTIRPASYPAPSSRGCSSSTASGDASCRTSNASPAAALRAVA